MGDAAKNVSKIATTGVMDLIGGAEKPKAAPKAPAPVTLEDPNVRRLAESKRRSLQGSRSQSRMLSTGRSATTLG